MAVMTSNVTQAIARAPVCILDARLLLEPLGLTLACRLARQVETWLVRRLWSLLDNDAFYQRWPSELGPDCTEEHAKRLGNWRSAWLDGQLNQRFFWVGDAKYESVLPCDADASLRERFERLAIELDPEADEVSAPSLDLLAQCTRDGIALAAALANDSPIILTTWVTQPEQPPLVRLAQQFGLFEVSMAPDLGSDLIAEPVRRIIAPLAQLGLRIAAVHVIAPEAALTAVDPMPIYDWDAEAEAPCAALWVHAGLVWQPLARQTA